MTTPVLPPAVAELASHAYWRSTIRPVDYDADRIDDSAHCLETLESISVRAGGWRYPFVSRQRERISVHQNYVDSLINTGHFLEFARLYRSGQFIYAAALREAFLDQDSEPLREAKWLADVSGSTTRPAGAINIVRLVRLVSVTFINAQRLVEKLKVDGSLELSMRLTNIAGYVLTAGHERQLDEYYPAADPTIDYQVELNAAALRRNATNESVRAAKVFFAGFHWLDPSDLVMRSLEEEALS
jgi:hypothetical protein